MHELVTLFARMTRLHKAVDGDAKCYVIALLVWHRTSWDDGTDGQLQLKHVHYGTKLGRSLPLDAILQETLHVVFCLTETLHVYYSATIVVIS